ncbi:MAG: nucleoid occlusion factor SlmA [Gallionella sp.]|nr:nucleoid occlusion factor SlmA [Gallionella sp.]
MATKNNDKKLQILQAVAAMLEQPNGSKITTAALAKRLGVSEAALYRHFASKAQMFEGLIEFIEQTLFGLINKITLDEKNGIQQARAILSLLLGFAQHNHGMTRVLTGDALVNEDERLQQRINQLLDRLESTLKQSLRMAMVQQELDAATDVSAHANVLLCFVLGRWQQFAKSNFARDPLEMWAVQAAFLLPCVQKA